MPLTPLHVGPGLMIGMVLQRWINLPAVLIASVIVDVRAVYCYFIGKCGLHGFFHTFVGAAILGSVVVAFVWSFRKRLLEMSETLKLEESYSPQSIIAGAMCGVWTHIILDSYMHSDMNPFWPLFNGNPLYGGMFAGFELLFICLLAFLIGGAVFVWRLTNYRRN